jgi:pantothenate kinase
VQDGYHYSIAYLQTMDKPDDKIYRRGAPDTFDAAGLKRDLGRIKNGDEEVVSIPGFDHAKGDPEPDAHVFRRSEHKIVICEGLYLVHDADGWEGIASLFDMTIFISSDVDMCISRLKIRNKCIPGYSPEEIEFRCDAVDRVNANTVMRSINHADVVVESAAALVAAPELEVGVDEEEDDGEAVVF